MTTIDTTAIAAPADVAVGQIRVNPFDGSRVLIRDTFMLWAGTLCTLRWKVYPADQPDGPVFGWVDHEVLSTWMLA
jgi:hypothetical protein